MGTPVHADLKERKIWVTFEFDPRVVELVKSVPGRRFINKEKGGPAWQLPLDLASARKLWAAIGQDLVVEPELKRWADQRVGAERELSTLALVEAAPLLVLPEKLPELWRALHVGPKGRNMTVKELEAVIRKVPDGSYQTADVRYLARAANPLNGNQPGLGKTLETIGAIFEAGIEEGPHLVLAPLTSLETVWVAELERWQNYPVWLATGSAAQRELMIEDFLNTEGPGWLVCNHHMVQMERLKKTDNVDQYVPKFSQLYELEWNSVILDEVHKAGFRDTNSLMYRGFMGLHADKKFALSGTPVGGKPINLWHILHWLEPDEFSNKWQWADRWCEIRDNGYGKVIERLREDLEEEFYKYHAPYFLRRLKSEVLPDLPPKQEIDVWVDMDGKQAKQYMEMALAAEVKIEDEHLTALGILAEYTRLKQFADSACRIIPKPNPDGGEPLVTLQPTEESCKLLALEQILEERDIFEGGRDEQVVVFSQFSGMIDMVYLWLQKKGVDVLKLTGATNQADRKNVQQTFQAGGAQVICMTTTAGGVSITLDLADTVVFLDETWDPGDQEQASDRVHRASRIHQVSVYTIRSKASIEEYIQKVLFGKENVNKVILDLRRQGLRATGIESGAGVTWSNQPETE